MPLLGIFKKSASRSRTTATASNVGSNISLNDDDYVSVVSHNSQQPSASTSKLGIPFRRHPQQAQQSQSPYIDPLLEPPPRRSSLFRTFQDDPSAYGSTQSLPDSDRQHQARLKQPSQNLSASDTNTTPKKSMFNWKSSKSKTASSTKEDKSFNLKSFRHVRPDSPSSLSPPPSPLNPIPTPIPTTVMPSPPVSFQVTSRRPRNTTSDHSLSITNQTTTSQQKMAVGVFRQAARRSSTSLNLTDSPKLSPVTTPTRSSLDDRPPPSLLPPAQVRSSTPTRTAPPRPPASLDSHTSAPTANFRARMNAFAASSSSSNDEEDEDEDANSTDDGNGLARRATIKPRARDLPPLSATVRAQIQRATPPMEPAQPRAQSSLGVYGPGRQRASLSVGALSPNAKEARASVAIVTNTRMNAPRSPSTAGPGLRPTPRRSAGSDTSESASDSDEDKPLSSLVHPRRAGTSMSSSSSASAPRKPLVDLSTPSTLTGRPVRAPPPMEREENIRAKTRVSTYFASQGGSQDSQGSKASLAQTAQGSGAPQILSGSKPAQAQVSTGSRNSQAPAQQDSKTSSAQQKRLSQASTQQTLWPSQGRSFSSPENLATPARAASRPSLSPPSVVPPMRPFARRESPASSTGDSSSGKAPLTPRDGSDLGRGTNSTYSETASRGRRRKSSVTFEDEQESGAKGKERDSVGPQEARLRERRRNEARAAIELGNVVNGPPPVDEDDVALVQNPGLQMGWSQSGMQVPMPQVTPMFNMGMGMNMSMPSPGGFGYGGTPPGVDAAYLAAHQQAMAIAKQTFQYAVAQQALAAANEEWERNSNTGAPWGGSQWGGGSNYGLGMGMGMGMRTSVVFPPAPRSMYAGSIGGGGGGGAWGGTGSVYGEPFGPARQSIYSQGDLSGATGVQQRTVRPRTKTAPSAPAPPVGAGTRRAPPPPSSYRGIGR